MKKTSETLLLKLAVKNGEVVMQPNKKADADARFSFLQSYETAIKNGVQVFVKAHYEIVTDLYVDFYVKRQHFHAYLRTILSEGYEPWTKSITAPTLDERVNELRRQMKQSYCNAWSYPPFSLSDKKTSYRAHEDIISYEDAIKRMEWMIQKLYDAHKEMTLKETGIAWAPAPYRNEE